MMQKASLPYSPRNKISNLDSLRVWVMKLIFSRSIFFKRVYKDERLRMLFISLSCCLISSVFSIFVPILVVIITPFIYGIPHALIGLNILNPAGRDIKNLLTIFTCLLLYFVTKTFFHIGNDLSFDIVIALGLSLYFIFKTQRSFLTKLKLVFATVMLSALMLQFHVNIILYLILGHNFISLIYLYFSSIKKKRQKIALLITVFFLFGHLFIWWMAGEAHSMMLSVLPLSEFLRSIGFTGDLQTGYKILSIYAFGQTMHYFVWMKLIPDLSQSQKTPVSFQRYFKNYLNLGNRYYSVLMLAVFIGLLVYAFLSYNDARILYFSLVAYHTFVEILALPEYALRQLK